MEKENKATYILFLIASILFYISSILYFIDKNTHSAVINLCLGSSFLCLSSVYYKKDRKNNEEKEDNENKDEK